MAGYQKRGRRQKTDIDRLAARLWFTAVSTQSGMSPDQLEQFFDNRLRGGHVTVYEPSRIWRKYSKGVLPHNSRSGRPGLVEVVEQEFPGTAQWIHNPLWPVLNDQELSYRRMVELVGKCQREIRELFSVNPLASKASEALKISLMNWKQLVGFKSFEAFGCMILYCRFESRQGVGFRDWRIRQCRWWLHGSYPSFETIRTHRNELVRLLQEFAPELGDLTYLGTEPPDNDDQFAELIFDWLFSRDSAG